MTYRQGNVPDENSEESLPNTQNIPPDPQNQNDLTQQNSNPYLDQEVQRNMFENQEFYQDPRNQNFPINENFHSPQERQNQRLFSTEQPNSHQNFQINQPNDGFFNQTNFQNQEFRPQPNYSLNVKKMQQNAPNYNNIPYQENLNSQNFSQNSQNMNFNQNQSMHDFMKNIEQFIPPHMKQAFFQSQQSFYAAQQFQQNNSNIQSDQTSLNKDMTQHRNQNFNFQQNIPLNNENPTKMQTQNNISTKDSLSQNKRIQEKMPPKNKQNFQNQEQIPHSIIQNQTSLQNLSGDNSEKNPIEIQIDQMSEILELNQDKELDKSLFFDDLQKDISEKELLEEFEKQDQNTKAHNIQLTKPENQAPIPTQFIQKNHPKNLKNTVYHPQQTSSQNMRNMHKEESNFNADPKVDNYMSNTQHNNFKNNPNMNQNPQNFMQNSQPKDNIIDQNYSPINPFIKYYTQDPEFINDSFDQDIICENQQYLRQQQNFNPQRNIQMPYRNQNSFQNNSQRFINDNNIPFQNNFMRNSMNQQTSSLQNISENIDPWRNSQNQGNFSLPRNNFQNYNPSGFDTNFTQIDLKKNNHFLKFHEEKIVHFIKHFEVSENGVQVEKYLISTAEFFKFSKLLPESEHFDYIRHDNLEGMIVDFDKLNQLEAQFMGIFGRPELIFECLSNMRMISQSHNTDLKKYCEKHGSGLYLIPFDNSISKELKILLILYSPDKNDFDRVDDKKSYARLLRYLTQLCNINVIALNPKDVSSISFDIGKKVSRPAFFIPQETKLQDDECKLFEGKRIQDINLFDGFYGNGVNCGYFSKKKIESLSQKKQEIKRFKTKRYLEDLLKKYDFNVDLDEMQDPDSITDFLRQFYMSDLIKLKDSITKKIEVNISQNSDEIQKTIQNSINIYQGYYIWQTMKQFFGPDILYLKDGINKKNPNLIDDIRKAENYNFRSEYPARLKNFYTKSTINTFPLSLKIAIVYLLEDKKIEKSKILRIISKKNDKLKDLIKNNHSYNEIISEFLKDESENSLNDQLIMEKSIAEMDELNEAPKNDFVEECKEAVLQSMYKELKNWTATFSLSSKEKQVQTMIDNVFKNKNFLNSNKNSLIHDFFVIFNKLLKNFKHFFDMSNFIREEKRQYAQRYEKKLVQKENMNLLKSLLHSNDKDSSLKIYRIVIDKSNRYNNSYSIELLISYQYNTPEYLKYDLNVFEITARDRENLNCDADFVITPKKQYLAHTKVYDKEKLILILLFAAKKFGVLINKKASSELKFYDSFKNSEIPFLSKSFGHEVLLSDFSEKSRQLAIISQNNGLILVIYLISADFILSNPNGQIDLGERFQIHQVKLMKLGKSNEIFVVNEQDLLFKIDIKNQTTKQIKVPMDEIQNILIVPNSSCLLLINYEKIVPYIVDNENILPEIILDFSFDPKKIMLCHLDNQIHLLFNYHKRIFSKVIKCIFSASNYSLFNINSEETDQIDNKSGKSILDYFSFIYNKYSVYNPLEDIAVQRLSQHFFIYFEKYKKMDFNLQQTVTRKMREIQSRIRKPYSQNLGLADNLHFIHEGMNSADNIFNISEKRQLDRWIQELICFVPIQIARSENNQYIIMNNGFPLSIEDSKNVFDIQKKISFGLYESIFNYWNKPIKVISSMGKQSTGKSYTLNHLSGATFAIAGGRCTDGCWFTIKITEDCLYVMMDFEGLGSFERSEQEDMLLSLKNASLSNITLFKTEFAISKETDQMFNRFNQAATYLKGDDRIFKGCFCIIIKDARDNDIKDLRNEYQEKMNIIIKREEKKDFITTMYKSGFWVWPFPSLDLDVYYDEMESLCHQIKNNIKATFTNGKEFLNMLKTIMAKIAIQDFTSLNRQEIDLRLHILQEGLDNAIYKGNLSETKSSIKDYVLKSLDNNNKEVDEEIEIEIDGEKTISYFDPQIELLPDNQDLVRLFSNEVPRTHEYHIEWHKSFTVFVGKSLEERIKRVQDWIKLNLEKWRSSVDFKEIIDGFLQKVQYKTNEIQNYFKICSNQCDSCKALCTLPNAHPEKHDCGFESHECKSKCYFCENEGQVADCELKFGHNDHHMCMTKPHTCGEPCHYDRCDEICIKPSLHTGDHQCGANFHSCPHDCSLPGCKGRCQINADKEHTVHKCVENKCVQKCEIKTCQISCADKDHFHGYDDLSSLFKKENGIIEQENIDPQNSNKVDFHCCGHEHQCPIECEQDGYCKVTTERKIVKSDFQGQRGTFQYQKQFENIGEKLNCCVIIPSYHRSHAGAHNHTADTKNFHTCKAKCPACNNICEKEVNHQGRHNTTHGNMVQCNFIADQKDVDIGDHKYVAGESAMAEMCNMLCKSLGRGHIHPVICGNAKDQCPNQQENQRRHETCKYGPDENVSKDELTHETYWEFINFEDPCTKEEQENFKGCPFYCGSSNHDNEKDKKYCQLPAWHKNVTSLSSINKTSGFLSPDGHYFNCSHPSTTQGFHFYLCLDNSGSMSGQPWQDLAQAVKSFCASRNSSQADRLTIIEFSSSIQSMCDNISFPQFNENQHLRYHGGGTCFDPPLKKCDEFIQKYLSQKNTPVILFMSDGCASDGDREIANLGSKYKSIDIKIFTIAFGSSIQKLQTMANVSNGKYLVSITGLDLQKTFNEISSQLGTKIGVITSKK